MDLPTLQKALEKSGQAQHVRLWPDSIEDTPDGAMKFLKHCRTWNEAEGEVQLFPVDLPWVPYFVDCWYEARESGGILIVEKCRRMVVSWLFRSLELFKMGLGRTDQAIVNMGYEEAAKHVWRLSHLYNDLQRVYQHWELPPARLIREQGDRQLRNFTLPNGSSCVAINAEENSFPGDGYGHVSCEEFGRYPSPASVLAQCRIVTQGSAKKVGGCTVLITNAWPSVEWWRIKGDPRGFKKR